VEQRAEDGIAEELYQQIKLDRENKIAQGLIKRDKRIEANFEEEELFDIPETWKWVTLGSILLKLTDGTHKTPKYAETGVKFVSVKDMSSGVLSLENTKFITEDEHKELYNRCNPQKGDMLLSKVGTTGVPAIIDTDEEFSLFVSVALLKYNHAYINQKYLYYLLQSPLVQKQAAENTRGVGNKNWVLDAISKTVIPLPPLAEQHRIVAKIEELLPYCDRLVEK
jgi:type I restriction enzyme S subunit